MAVERDAPADKLRDAMTMPDEVSLKIRAFIDSVNAIKPTMAVQSGEPGDVKQAFLDLRQLLKAIWPGYDWDDR